MVNLAPLVGVVNLTTPVGVVNLASLVGVVNLTTPVGVVYLTVKFARTRKREIRRRTTYNYALLKDTFNSPESFRRVP